MIPAGCVICFGPLCPPADAAPEFSGPRAGRQNEDARPLLEICGRCRKELATAVPNRPDLLRPRAMRSTR